MFKEQEIVADESANEVFYFNPKRDRQIVDRLRIATEDERMKLIGSCANWVKIKVEETWDKIFEYWRRNGYMLNVTELKQYLISNYNPPKKL